MFSFRVILLKIVIASFLFRKVSGLVNKGPVPKSPTFSAAEQAALSHGEDSLFGNYDYFGSSHYLWSGKKNAANAPFRGRKHEDQSKSFTPRTRSNQSSFVPKKAP